MKQLLFAFSFLLSIAGYSQGDQILIKVPINSVATETAILHLPDDYSTTTTSYPLMVFLHGVGEGGTNPASIYNSASAGGPAYYIAQNKFPSSFINPADGKSYKYIVVSLQSTNGWSTTAPQLDTALTFLKRVYRVDPARIYLTGLSAGGEGILEYVAKLTGPGVKVVQNNKIAAFIPMSAVMNANNRTLMGDTIVANQVRMWAFGDTTGKDTHGQNTIDLAKWYVNPIKPGWAIATGYTGGHCCWGQFYDPNFKQNGMNIYQWALQYTSGVSGSSTVVIPPPVIVSCPTVDSVGIIKAYLAGHPCPICPVADSAGIIKAYVATHPCPTCPICPVCPKQRSMIGIHTDIVGGVCMESILYDDGSTQFISK